MERRGSFVLEKRTLKGRITQQENDAVCRAARASFCKGKKTRCVPVSKGRGSSDKPKRKKRRPQRDPIV